MKPATTLFVLGFALVASPAFAEPPSAEDILLGSTTDTPTSSPPSGLDAMISQTGTGNTAVAYQRDRAEGLSAISLSQTGSDNTAILLQSGSDNLIKSGQTGDGNLTVAQQLGLGNVLITQQTGDNLGVIVRQYGGSAVSVSQSGQ
jgi:hypothetical protein